jgi:hypothetical protein
MQVPAGVSIGGSAIKLFLASLRGVMKAKDVKRGLLLVIDRPPCEKQLS